MADDDTKEMLEKIETAAMLYSISSSSTRIAFVSLIQDLPLWSICDSDTVDFDVEEARYRLRAVILEEARRGRELLDLIGE